MRARRRSHERYAAKVAEAKAPIGIRAELATQAPLRRGLFPQTFPAHCDFYCGYALDDRCRRCGASWVAHYSGASDKVR